MPYDYGYRTMNGLFNAKAQRRKDGKTQDPIILRLCAFAPLR